MAANSSIVLTNLDFDGLKNSFKAFLKTQDRFKDYDFDGSNISVLLDLLAFNTYQNAYYLNMVASEMFLDTAQIRDSVMSHAKELNYLPRSFTSAQATIDITVTSTDPNKTSILMPKGTQFTTRVGSNTYTFSTVENFVATGQGVFGIDGVNIYEGDLITETFTTANNVVLQNPNLDVSSIKVTVLEDSAATVLEYQRSISLFGLDENSQVFFVQGAPGDKYEIVFGDGVIGRQPKMNSVVLVEYRVSNGELPNGAIIFRAASTIDGEANVSIITSQAAHSGSISEDLDSIRYNAPRHFTTQERAVTTEDYENLLRINFPEINSVTAFGGEDAVPVQFGKIFISVDLTEIDGIPEIKRQQYEDFLKTRCPVSFHPVVIDPEYTYIDVVGKVRYNINVTSRNAEDVRTLVIQAITNFSSSHLNDFNKTLRYSRLIEAIDDADPSIVSNETSIRVIKKISPTLGVDTNLDLNFTVGVSSVVSSKYVTDGRSVFISDDGKGTLFLRSGTTGEVISSIGSVNYATGLIQLENFNVTSFSGSSIKIYAAPQSVDITTTRNVILSIVPEDITITVEKIRE